jgi:hypothetical protein
LYIYILKGNEITITNNDDLTIVQDRNPETQMPFTSEEEAIAWATKYIKTMDINANITNSFDVAKAIKKKDMMDSYNKELYKGFSSEASGTLSNYDYTESSQTKLSKLFLLKANNIIEYPTAVFTKENEIQMLSEEQLTKLLTDLAKWEWSVQFKFHEKTIAIEAAANNEELEAIVW